MMHFLIRLIINAIAIWVAVKVVPGITFTGPWAALLAVALVFGLINAFVRPLLKILTCSLIILTLGLFTLIINGLMLWLTSAVSEALNLGFHVAGFWAAFWGALVISVVSILLALLVKSNKEKIR